MTTPRSPGLQSQKVHQIQTDVALLKQTTSTLEHTVVAQNASVKSELAGINASLREIQDKLDKVTLEYTVSLVRQSEATKTLASEVADNAKEIERVNGKITKAAGGLFAVFIAILSGVMAWLTPGGKA